MEKEHHLSSTHAKTCLACGEEVPCGHKKKFVVDAERQWVSSFPRLWLAGSPGDSNVRQDIFLSFSTVRRLHFSFRCFLIHGARTATTERNLLMHCLMRFTTLSGTALGAPLEVCFPAKRVS